MKRFTFHVDSACGEILDLVDEESDLSRSEFARRSLKLGAAVAGVEGVNELPDDHATEEEIADWIRDRYPRDGWPEGLAE